MEEQAIGHTEKRLRLIFAVAWLLKRKTCSECNRFVRERLKSVSCVHTSKFLTAAASFPVALQLSAANAVFTG